MKMKKSICTFLAVAMTVSAIGFSASAASETATENQKTVKHWVYSEEFDNKTVDTLKLEGWTLPDGAEVVSTTDSYLNAAQKNTIYYTPGDGLFGDDYTIKAKQSYGYNAYGAYMTIAGDGDVVYRIYPCSASTDSVVKITKHNTKTYKEVAILGSKPTINAVNYSTYTYDIKVYNVEEGIKIVANIYNSKSATPETPVTVEAIDTEPLEVSKIGICWGATDSCKLYNFSAHSIVDEAETVAFDNEIIDKIFTSDDNYTTLKNAGFYSATEKGMNNGDYSLKTYPSYTDESGMRYTGGNLFYYYDSTSSNYTIEADMYKRWNESIIYFNMSADMKSYYALESTGNAKTAKLYKFVDGKEVTDLTKTEINIDSMAKWSDYKINCDYQVDGSLVINAEVKPIDDNKVSLTLIDKSPLTGKNIKIYPKDEGKVKRFRITAPATYTNCDGDMPVFVPRFYNASGEVITAIENGKIYANSFARLLNEHTITAAMYEDGIMTGIKKITSSEIADMAELFEVTDAENTVIKLFVLDNGTELNKVMETVELN